MISPLLFLLLTFTGLLITFGIDYLNKTHHSND